jgi:SAM-dependent methyltransferase
MGSSETYRKFAQFYDAYVGNFREDLPLYVSLCEVHNRILEIGCGTGRVLEPLLEAGHSLMGVDISPAMLAIAAKKLAPDIDRGKLTLLEHDFRRSALPELFSCVLVTFYTFNYLLEDNEQAVFLRNIALTMNSGGVLIIDLFYPRSLSKPETTDRWEQSTYEVEGKSVVLEQKRKMIGTLEERIQRYDQEGNHEEIRTLRRYVDKDRILRLLTEAGFVNVKCADHYDLSCFHELSEGEGATSNFVVVAAKP